MFSIPATGKEILTRLSSAQAKILVNGQAGLVRELEPYRSARLLLSDGRPIHGVPARRHIVDAQSDDVTAA